MPAHRKTKSKWREMMVATHSHAVQELRRKVKKTKTPFQGVDYINEVRAIQHLAQKTQHNIIMAIMSHFVRRKEITKQGAYYVPTKG